MNTRIFFALLLLQTAKSFAQKSLFIDRQEYSCATSFNVAVRTKNISNVVALLKDTSLAYNIGVLELVNAGQRVQSRTFDPVPILITTALLYLIMTTLLTKITNGVEHYYDYEGRIP